MSVVTSLDHVVIAVTDLDAATSSFGALLGLTPSWQGEHRAFGTHNTLFRLRNTYVELLAASGEGAIADFVRAHLAEHGEGPLAIALGSTDAKLAAAELRTRDLHCPDPAEGEGNDRSSAASRRWLSFVIPPSQTRAVAVMVIQHLDPPDVLRPAQPREGIAAASAVAGVDHVVLMTSDADAAISLYRDVLGLRLALDRTFEERALRLLFFRIGGITIECAAPLGAATPSSADRFWGVSYRVDDVAAARERLVAEGFDVSEVRRGMKPGTRVCTVRTGTHGVATLLIGPDEAAA